jgi:hypothetical protein
MNPQWKVVFKTCASLACGAFVGVIEQVIIEAHGRIDKVDWHQAGMVAAGTAAVAVMAHYFPPPTARG